MTVTHNGLTAHKDAILMLYYCDSLAAVCAVQLSLRTMEFDEAGSTNSFGDDQLQVGGAAHSVSMRAGVSFAGVRTL